MPNVEVRGAPHTELNRSRRTLVKKKTFKTATGRRVPLTALLGRFNESFKIAMLPAKI